MKRKLAFLLLVVAAAGSGMSAMDTKKIISTLKCGIPHEKTVVVYETRAFGYAQIMCSGFTPEDVFVLNGISSFALNKNFNKEAQSLEGSFEVNDKKDREGLYCLPIYEFLDDSLSLKHAFSTMTAQRLQHGNILMDTIKVVATKEYDQKKSEERSKKEFFFYFNPKIGFDATPVMVCGKKGLLYGIMAPFPGDTYEKGTDDEVMEYVKKNTRVCVFKVVDGKLELLRDMGKYPYCKGVYMNLSFNCMAILYGNGKNVPSTLSMVQFKPTHMFDLPR